MHESIDLTHAPARPPRRRAEGFRRESSQTTHWRQQAATYRGLPEGIKHPHEVMDILRQARAGLKLTDAELALLTDLYAATQPRDWHRRPLAWPSNDTLASRMGRSISAVQRMVQRLAGLGLIVMQDSPTGKRYGIRDAEGHIVKAFGFDLSLLALRAAEFRALAAKRQAEDAQIKAARARAHIARRQLLAVIDAAEEAQIWSAFWQDAAARGATLSSSLGKIRDANRLENITHQLTALLVETQTALARTAATSTETPPDTSVDETTSSNELGSAHRVDATLNNTTNPSFNENCNNAQQACKSPLAASGYPEFAKEARPPRVSERGDPLDHVDLPRLIAGTPELTRRDEPIPDGWPDLRAACLPLLARYDISRRLFLEAEDVLGRRMPTMIFCIMLAHGRDHYRSPGGAFRRMVERADKGQLHILPSYYGLTSAQEASSTRVQATSPSEVPLSSVGAVLNRIGKRLL